MDRMTSTSLRKLTFAAVLGVALVVAAGCDSGVQRQAILQVD
jgi:hypothetical protein